MRKASKQSSVGSSGQRRPRRRSIACSRNDYQHLEPRRLLAVENLIPGAPEVLGTANDDAFVLRLDPTDSDFIEIEFNGIVAERFELAETVQIVLRGLGGNDSFTIDYSHGDPTPEAGFVLAGGNGSDTISVVTLEDVEYRIKDIDGSSEFENREDQIDGFLRVNTEEGLNIPIPLRICNWFYDIESFNGGQGNDLFFFSTVGQLASFVGDVAIDAGTGVNQLKVGIHSGTQGIDIVVGQDEISGYFDGAIEYSATGGVFQNTDSEGNADPDNPGGVTLFARQTNFTVRNTVTVGSFLNQNSLLLRDFDARDSLTIGDEDELVVSGTILIDTAPGSSNISSRGVVVLSEDIQQLTLDVHNVTNAVEPPDLSRQTIQVHGTSADDEFTLEDLGLFFEANRVFSSGDSSILQFNVFGGPGNDLFHVRPELIRDANLYGEDGDDRFMVESGRANLFGGGGRDLLNQNGGRVGFDGGDGDDHLNSWGGRVFGEGDAGFDTGVFSLIANRDRSFISIENVELLVDDLEADNHFLFTTLPSSGLAINGTTVNFGAQTEVDLNTGGGNDTFEVVGPMRFRLNLDMGDGDDLFFYNNAQSFTGAINLDAGTGNNQLSVSLFPDNGDSAPIRIPSNITITETTIQGLNNGQGEFNYTATGGSFSRVDESIGGIEFIGTIADDVLRVAGVADGNTLRADTRGGDDVVFVAPNLNGPTFIFGNNGSDIYNVPIAAGANHRVTISDFGTIGADRVNVSSSAGDDEITLFGNRITDGNSEIFYGPSVDKLIVFGQAGNDQLIARLPQVEEFEFHGNAGNDILRVSQLFGDRHASLFGGIGNDQFELFETGHITTLSAFGSQGRDSFRARFDSNANTMFDGQGDGDTYRIFSDGLSNRQLNVSDTGGFGEDLAMVFGTNQIDRFQLDNQRIRIGTERIVSDGSIEQLKIVGAQGPDRFVVSGAFSEQVGLYGGEDGDNFIVNSISNTVLDLVGGAADDRFLIERSSNSLIRMFGGADGDRGLVGSAPNSATGNLAMIENSDLRFFGGEQNTSSEDRLFISNAASGAPVDFRLTGNGLFPIAGPNSNLVSPVRFNASTEFVQFRDSTIGNVFEVTGSAETRFLIDGNEPQINPFSRDQLNIINREDDGAEILLNPGMIDAGIVAFENQLQEIEFINITNQAIIDV